MTTFDANAFQVKVHWNRAGFVPILISFIDEQTGLALALNMTFEASGLVRISECCGDAVKPGRMFGTEGAGPGMKELEPNSYYCRNCAKRSRFEDQAFHKFSLNPTGARNWLEDLCYGTTELGALSSALYADLIIDRLLAVETLVRRAFVRGTIFDRDTFTDTRTEFARIARIGSEPLGRGVTA